jgi:sentrin-specific protease 1
MQEKRILYLDSLGGGGQTYTSAVMKYISDEWKDKQKSDFSDNDKWSIEDNRNNTPQQKNNHDCGVFVCMFAHLLSLNVDLNFDQNHIDQFRHRIAISILRKDAS